jgi:hypothetical protein
MPDDSRFPDLMRLKPQPLSFGRMGAAAPIRHQPAAVFTLNDIPA